ncbi:putative reverse transcriptase domain-containing protein, partial [Tanacetum coccineum]
SLSTRYYHVRILRQFYSLHTRLKQLFEDDSDIGSPGVDGPPIMPEDPYAYIMAAYGVPPSPDYIPGPEVPPSPDYIPGPEGPPSPDYVPGPEEPEQAPPSPVYLPYVPEPVYPEYIPPEDDVFLAEEQPLHAATSPTAESPGYIPESDPEEDPEEDPADYPADRDDDDDEEEEEEHPAPADFVPPVHRMTARISIRDEPSISLPPREERVTDLATIVEEETTSMYGIMEDAQDDRSLLRGRVNLLYRDRPIHSRLAVMVEREAKMAREAWGLSMDASDYARSDVMSLRTTVVAQSALISELQSADHMRHRGEYRKMAPRGRPTRLNPDATPTPVTDTHTTTSVTNAQIQAMINEGVTAALAARDATRNGDDSHTSGTGARRPVQVARECTYPDFLKCQPLNFKGTEGVVGLTQWFEKMESVYSISNCTVACQVKFATCTLQGNALTWWNSHVKTTTPEAAHAMPWRTLKKMMTDKYCPRGEIKKLEFEMWNLKINTWAERQADNKRKSDDTPGTTRNPQPKQEQNTGKKLAAGNGDRKPYGGPKPLCSKCNYHHEGPCAPKCSKCNRFGHLGRDCRSPPNVNTGANQRACFECGAQGHFKKDCPKLKNNKVLR